MEIYNKIKELVASMDDDMSKFYEKGNSSAGTRARKSLQELKQLSQELRLDIQNSKNTAK